MQISERTVGDVKILEGNGGTRNASVTVTLSAPSPGGVSVSYATANGIASAPSDYTAKSGTISFEANKTAKSIVVPIKGDGTFEQTALAENVAMGRWAWGADAFDFDNDGSPELFITTGMLTNSS